jgi:hypothetical protein
MKKSGSLLPLCKGPQMLRGPDIKHPFNDRCPGREVEWTGAKSSDRGDLRQCDRPKRPAISVQRAMPASRADFWKGQIQPAAPSRRCRSNSVPETGATLAGPEPQRERKRKTCQQSHHTDPLTGSSARVVPSLGIRRLALGMESLTPVIRSAAPGVQA